MLATLCTIVLAVQSVAEVRDPRPSGWVTDQAGVLDAAAEARLTTLLGALHDRKGAEMVVVTVDDVPGTPKQFATDLFDHWQLGNQGKDDGVLVLLVMGQRRLEVETGIGMEAALPAWWLAEVQERDMVPRFKQGKFGDGLEVGAVAMIERVLAPPAEGERDTRPGEYAGGAPSVPSAMTPPGGGPGAPPPAGSPPPSADADDGGTPWVPIGAGTGAVGLIGAGAFFARRKRIRDRTCQSCNLHMFELDEIADDAHLTAGQRTEERIGSKDHDVYVCRGCQETRVLSRSRWFSGRSRCGSCGFKTMARRSRTIVSATYDHGGQVEVTESCANCSHHRQSTHSTARLTRPSPSTSSGSRSSSSSSRGSSGGGGGGGGGGRSRGGGAGSSW